MCMTTKLTAEKWAGNRELAMMFHRRGYGFLKDCDLPELAKIDRLFPCLVRCGGCRFTCAVQDVSHLVGIIEASGQEHVRDIAMLMNPPPPKPGPYGTWEQAETEARSLNRAVEAGQCDPEAAAQASRHAAEVAANPTCPVDDEKCDGCAGVRAPCGDAAPATSIAEECAKVVKAAPVILPHVPKPTPPYCAFMGGNGPTGHGDICHSDADPGL